jgi:hypothetical protein
MSLTKRLIYKRGSVQYQEFSETENLQHSWKGRSLFMTGHKDCLQADYNNGRHILCSQSWTSNICFVNASDHSARKNNENCFIGAEDQGHLYPVLRSTDTEYSSFASSDSSMYVLVLISDCRNFLKNRCKGISFSRNKRQSTLTPFFIVTAAKTSNLTSSEGVCDATNRDSSISSLQSDLDIQT